jgi:ribose transport system ATP-binding protein
LTDPPPANSTHSAADGGNSEPLLLMSGIEKRFPGVHALRGVGLRVDAGEVLALLGENGAGKSTLIKVLGGAHRADSGDVRIMGKSVSIGTPAEAEAAGIAVIYQEFNLVPSLNAVETRFGFIRRSVEREKVTAILAKIGMEIDLDVPVRQLSVAQQQGVEIAKALLLDARVLVMDEPSATLTPEEVEKLYAVIRELQAQGIGIIYISHRLEEIFKIANRVTVLRDGSHVGDRNIGDIDRKGLIELMVGRPLESEFPPRTAKFGKTRLVVNSLKRSRKVRDVSFEIRGGEVLGVTGLVGAGRTETARLIFGADKREAGEVILDGKALDIRSPRDAIRAGICLLTEDRKHQGLLLGASVRDNFALPNLQQLSVGGFVRNRELRDRFAGYVASLQIKIPHQEQLARNLSGGNQQKVVLAKWLARNAEVIIFDEPTRGIDVGAKFEIYQLINELSAQGKAVLMISSELPEVLGMSDRILVMHEGRITGEITEPRSATQEQVMQLAVA